jgi:ABC-type phosphate transport system substrate-binding protein
MAGTQPRSRRQGAPWRWAALLALMSAVLVVGTGDVRGQAPPKDKTAFTVIVNPENTATEVTMQDLTRIYLGKKTLWDSGARISAGMLETEQPVMRAFIEKDVQRTLDQYRAYWKHMLFSGGGTAPRTFRTPAEVVDFVAREPGAIGIVAGSPAGDRVKVLEVRGGR